MAAKITVRQSAGTDPFRFDVTVSEGRSESRHDVTMSPDMLARLCSGTSPERCIESAFRFLLDRESKESILARFDVSVIARYFPEFERELSRYLRQE